VFLYPEPNLIILLVANTIGISTLFSENIRISYIDDGIIVEIFMKPTMIGMFSLLMALIIGLSFLTMVGPKLVTQTYAQSENETSEVGMENMTNATVPVAEILQVTPGEKTFYIFTSEVENVDENKLKVAGDSFSLQTIVANKGDKVNVNFYNVDDVQTEIHSFTIDDPYKVNIDLGFGQNGNATFTANQTGVFTYYCKYHLPVMTGQLLVLP
jgi:plastocyanin